MENIEKLGEKMENLNAEQIKKALECCAKNNFSKCTECPMGRAYQFCSQELCVKALSLITSQEQDKEKLGFLIDELEKEKQELWEERNRIYNDLQDWKAIAEQYQKQFEDCAEDRAKLTEENERLSSRNKFLEIEYKNQGNLFWARVHDAEEGIKADTVRKMQERLEELYTDEVITDDMTVSIGVIKQNIKDIAKKILEENK